MTLSLIIPRATLASAILAASTEQSRYYLQGVCVQNTPDSAAFTACATDGSVLFAERFAAEEGPDALTPPILPEGGLIIPSAAVKAALAQDKRDGIALAPHGAAWVLGSQVFTPIDGTFPDWRRVLPSQTSGEPALLHPIAWARAYAIALAEEPRLAKDKLSLRVNVHHNGEGPAVMTRESRPLMRVVVMPCRGLDVAAKPATFPGL